MAKALKQGDRWFQTRHTELAAVLTALDFEFWDEENACDIREVDGHRMVTWLFQSRDKNGELDATDVHKAWSGADKYCAEKPKCRIASAVAAAKNLRVFNEGAKKGVPLVGYKLGKHTMWVLKDSDRDKKLQGIQKAKRV